MHRWGCSWLSTHTARRFGTCFTSRNTAFGCTSSCMHAPAFACTSSCMHALQAAKQLLGWLKNISSVRVSSANFPSEPNSSQQRQTDSRVPTAYAGRRGLKRLQQQQLSAAAVFSLGLFPLGPAQAVEGVVCREGDAVCAGNVASCWVVVAAGIERSPACLTSVTWALLRGGERASCLRFPAECKARHHLLLDRLRLLLCLLRSPLRLLLLDLLFFLCLSLSLLSLVSAA